MKARHTALLLFFAVSPALLLVNSTRSTGTAPETPSTVSAANAGSDIVNVDGDVSLNSSQNLAFWNPHSTGLTDASTWNVTFNNETEIFLKTASSEAGHVAAGAWWTSGFRTNQRIPLYTSTPRTVLVTFRANVSAIQSEKGDEWLRFALACATKRGDGSVVYTEMDFWDSPSALRHPSGNIGYGGNVVYRGGDVVEYKIDQATIGQWTSYSMDLTRQIDSAWSLKPGDSLESVYAVIEVIGGVTVTLKVDDLWIMPLE